MKLAHNKSFEQIFGVPLRSPPQPLNSSLGGTMDNEILITPMLAFELSRHPYDFGLWWYINQVVIKQDVCFLTTQELAEKTKMSTGKVSDSRKYLLSVGLLEGEIKKAIMELANGSKIESHQAVWHLTIPKTLPPNNPLAHELESSAAVEGTKPTK